MSFTFGAPKQPTPGAPAAGAPATTAPGGFSFGTTPAAGGAPATAAPAGGFSFGAATPAAAAGGGFSFGAAPAKTTAPSTSTPGGFSFGGATSTPASAPAPGGFSFGTPAPAASTTQAATTAPAGFSLGSAPALGNAPVLGQATAAPSMGFGAKQTLTTTAAAGFSLAKPANPAGLAAAGLAPTGLAPTGLAPAGLAPTTSSAPSALSSFLKPTGAAAPTVKTGLSLAMPSKAPATSLTTATTAPSLSLGAMGKLPATSSTLSSISVAPAPAAVSTGPKMSYQQLEQAINKWTVELEEQEKIFLKQATQVNAWDRLLIENGEKITSLHNDMEKVKADQQRLEHELDYIVAQQKELEDMLVPLEETVATQQQGTIYTQHADLERERTYQLAENTDGQLKRMVQDLKDIIDHLNTTNTPMDTNDPMNQIAKILNAHMDSLQWIDQNSVMLQRKVDEVAKQSDIVRRDQERNVHLAFD